MPQRVSTDDDNHNDNHNNNHDDNHNNAHGKHMITQATWSQPIDQQPLNPPTGPRPVPTFASASPTAGDGDVKLTLDDEAVDTFDAWPCSVGGASGGNVSLFWRPMRARKRTPVTRTVHRSGNGDGLEALPSILFVVPRL